jgi:thiol-disulfide isomerase/thioredoxin
MFKIIQLILQRIRPYYKIINIVSISIFFIIACFLLYYLCFLPYKKNKNFKKLLNGEPKNQDITVRFFYADWCPHCVKSKPQWNEYCSQYIVDSVDANGNNIYKATINGYNVTFISYDCSNNDVISNQDGLSNLLDEYNVNSYPTIIMDGKDLFVNFDSKITTSSLDKFVNNVLVDGQNNIILDRYTK